MKRYWHLYISSQRLRPEQAFTHFLVRNVQMFYASYWHR